MQVYIHFQDLVSVYVGPFRTFEQINAHLAFCRKRHDSARVMGIVKTVPEAEMKITPEQDVSAKVTKYSPAQLAALRQMEAMKLEHKLGDEECYLFGLYATGEQFHTDGECTDPMSFVTGALESNQVRFSLEEFQNFLEKMA